MPSAVQHTLPLAAERSAAPTFTPRFAATRQRCRKSERTPKHWRAIGDGATRFALYAKGAAPAELGFVLPDGQWSQRWYDAGSGMLLREDTVEAKDGAAILKMPDCCSEVALDLALAK